MRSTNNKLDSVWKGFIHVYISFKNYFKWHSSPLLRRGENNFHRINIPRLALKYHCFIYLNATNTSKEVTRSQQTAYKSFFVTYSLILYRWLTWWRLVKASTMQKNVYIEMMKNTVCESPNSAHAWRNAHTLQIMARWMLQHVKNVTSYLLLPYSKEK